MNSKELEQYRQVQGSAKDVMDIIADSLQEGITEREIKEIAEQLLRKKGIDSFWYYDIGALVFVGRRTLLSISGKEYEATDTPIKTNDLVTIDLSPEKNGYWGDYARSFVIEGGEVVSREAIKSAEMREGIVVEEEIHRKFQNLLQENMTFEEVFQQMNFEIERFGFENLDFVGNLGHSIEKQKKDRIYIENGNKKKLKEVEFFTFEPHIKKKEGMYGFKREDIYYFDDKGILHIL